MASNLLVKSRWPTSICILLISVNWILVEVLLPKSSLDRTARAVLIVVSAAAWAGAVWFLLANGRRPLGRK